MRRFLKSALTILCVLLCISLCIAYRTSIRKQSGAGEDKYRTTYEILVYSFCDSNGDRIGDLNGIRSKLDYIKDLGFNAIWLTPIHPSSTYHKYDVDDYFAVDPEFGTMEDYEALLNECHERDIRVYLDLVLNHTSEDHGWFKAASDYLRELPSGWDPDPSYCKYYDYYNFTRQPSEGFVQLEGTEWYYEARFWSEMPDLNLSSDSVRDEIRYILDYWINKGVDGFRLDAVTSYYEGNTEANVEFLKFLTDTARSIDPDCYIVGEAWTDRDTIASLYSSGIDSLFDFPFANNTGIIAETLYGNRPASDYVNEMILTEKAYLNADPNYVDAPFYTNHDMNRSAEYYDYDNGPVTKMAYAMNLFMTGNAFVYYGEEIGMMGEGKDDNKRAPMYWSNDPYDPDMCHGSPYIDQVQMKYPSAEDQMKDKLSIWHWFRDVIRIRNTYPVIAMGVTERADYLCDDNTAAFFRKSDDADDVLIVMNLRSQPAEKDLSSICNTFTMAASLSTGGENVVYQDGTLNLPGYSIAIFN